MTPKLFATIAIKGAALGITLDEFATYYPVADVRKSSAAMPTREEHIDNVLAELRAILV